MTRADYTKPFGDAVRAPATHLVTEERALLLPATPESRPPGHCDDSRLSIPMQEVTRQKPVG